MPEASTENRANLVSAADVLMYLGNLDSVFVIASKLLADGGLFAFSVEDGGEEGDFVLRQSLRYAHSESYIQTALQALWARYSRNPQNHHSQ